MSFQDKNWLATVALANARWILWLTGAVAFLVLVATYLLATIYQARSVLVVDSDLSSIFRGMTIPYPTKTQGDYIRYEYFATHAVTLMSETSLSAALIDKLDLDSGRKPPLKPEKFINPKVTDLLFSNDGLGVGVKWIADTQQFAISGYSTDPDQAMLISETYARLFLKRNAAQYADTLRQVIVRADAEIRELSLQLEEIETSMAELRAKSETSLPRTEVELAAARIGAIIEEIEGLQSNERLYNERLSALTEQERDLERLRTAESSLQANPYAQSIQEQIGALVADLAKASVEFTPMHPERKAIESQIQTLEGNLRAEVERTFSSETLRVPDAIDSVITAMVDYTVAHRTHQASLASLQATLASERRRAAEFAAAATRMETLSEQRTALVESLSDAMSGKSRFASLLEAALPAYRFVEPPFLNKAYLKYYKLFPKRKSLLLKVVLAVGMLGAFFALGRDLYARPAHRAWQIEEETGGIPCAEVDARDPAHQLDAALARVWRRVREARVIALVSTGHTSPDDAVALALARLAQSSGTSCLVVDARADQGRITRACGMTGQPGLLDILHGSSSFEKVVRDLPSHAGRIIPCGQPGNAAKFPPAVEFFGQALAAAPMVLVSMNCAPDESPGLFGAWPDHHMLLLGASGQLSLHTLPARTDGDARNVAGVILHAVPVRDNPLSLRGAFALARHLLTPPVPQAVLSKITKAFPSRSVPKNPPAGSSA